MSREAEGRPIVADGARTTGEARAVGDRCSTAVRDAYPQCRAVGPTARRVLEARAIHQREYGVTRNPSHDVASVCYTPCFLGSNGAVLR